VLLAVKRLPPPYLKSVELFLPDPVRDEGAVPSRWYTILGIKIEPRVLLARTNTRAVEINVAASGWSLTTIRMGHDNTDAIKEINSAFAMYLLSANSVLRFRALQA
jgi:hypothetical protein